MNLSLVVVAAFAALGGFLFGHDLGLIGGALLDIQESFNTSPVEDALIVCTAKVGAVVGAFLGGAHMHHYGRRGAIFMDSVFFTLGPAIMACSVTVGMLVLGRVLVGIGVGYSAVVIPVYLAELAPPRLRGSVVTTYELMLCVGMVFSCLVDARVQDWDNNWRWMVGLPIVPACFLALAPFVLPESPRWLVTIGDFSGALAVLSRIRHGKPHEIRHELDEIREGIKSEQVPRHDVLPPVPSHSSLESGSSLARGSSHPGPSSGANGDAQPSFDAPSFTVENLGAPVNEVRSGTHGESCSLQDMVTEGSIHDRDLHNTPFAATGGSGSDLVAASETHHSKNHVSFASGDVTSSFHGNGQPQVLDHSDGNPLAISNIWNLASGPFRKPSSRKSLTMNRGSHGPDDVLHLQPLGHSMQNALHNFRKSIAWENAHGYHMHHPEMEPSRSALFYNMSTPWLTSDKKQTFLSVLYDTVHDSCVLLLEALHGHSPDEVAHNECLTSHRLSIRSSVRDPSGLWNPFSPRDDTHPPFHANHLDSEVSGSVGDFDGFLASVAPDSGGIKSTDCRAVRIGLALAFFNQISASTSILNYAPELIQQVGIHDKAYAMRLAALVSGFKAFGIIIGVAIIDLVGRRSLLATGSAGCSLAMFLLAFAVLSHSAPLTIFSMCWYIFMFSSCWAGTFWVICSEIFSMRVKSSGMALATGALFLSGALADFFFPVLLRWLGGSSFIAFGLLAAAGWVYVLAWVPETRGLSLQDVQKII